MTMMTMTHTEKQFLYDIGEENWTDTWFDIFPEEVLQLIYRFVYNDAIRKLSEHQEAMVAMCYHDSPSTQQRMHKRIFAPLIKKYEKKGWELEKAWHNKMQNYIQKDIGYDNGFKLKYQQNRTLHDFKMGVANNANQRYTDTEVTWVIERGSSSVHYPKFIIYEGFGFRQAEICYYNENDIDHIRLFCFGITYVNENVGKIEFRSKTFDRSETNKKSKRFIKYPEDFLAPRVLIYEKNITYYNDYKQSF